MQNCIPKCENSSPDLFSYDVGGLFVRTVTVSYEKSIEVYGTNDSIVKLCHHNTRDSKFCCAYRRC